MSGLQETPAAQRLHIALYGRRNAGKSSLINALTGQQVALVSPVAGTTADPVKKAMELHPIGPVLFIDTAGYDDEGELGQLRVEATRDTLTRADVALLVIAGAPSQEDLQWAQQLKEQNTPFLVVQTKGDLAAPAQLPPDLAERAVAVSAATGEGIEALRAALTALVPEDFGRQDLTRGLCSAGDVVLLVMPQDIQAPKGRLILPQVRTIRHLLDLKCTVVSTTADGLDGALAACMVVNHACNEGYRSVAWGVEAADDELLVIHALGVRRACSGRGLAREMARRVLQMARAQGLKTVRLDVLGGNLPAERAYTAVGFRHVDTLRMFYEDTGWTDYKAFEYLL